MKTMKIVCIAACSALLSVAAQAADTPSQAQDRPAQDNETAQNQDRNAATPSDTDNTKVNMRDRNDNEATADQATNNQSDREAMQKIRKAIVADKSLSTYAHNVKIIAENGSVTLKGPVKSNAERKKVEEIAANVVGQDNVTSEISVKKQSRRG